MYFRTMTVGILAIVLSVMTQFSSSATEATEPNVVEVPEIPSTTDPCNVTPGQHNATWNMPSDDGTFRWTLNDESDLSVTIVAESTTFPDGSTSYDYGQAPDSQEECPQEPNSGDVRWTNFEKRCLSSGSVMTSAHRGMGSGIVSYAGRRYAEDTLPALLQGMRLGTCSVETDYWVTKGGCIVSHHDATLRRMTDRSGSIRRSSCRYVTNARHATGVNVPTFEAIQRQLKKAVPWSCFRQQEIKRGALTEAALRRMVSFNRQLMKAEECIMYTSAERKTLRLMHRLSPRSTQGLIVRSQLGRPALGTVPRFIDRIMLHHKAVTPDYVRRANRLGFEISARSVNTVSLFQRMKSYGVRYIVTDRAAAIGPRR